MRKHIQALCKTHNMSNCALDIIEHGSWIQKKIDDTTKQIKTDTNRNKSELSWKSQTVYRTDCITSSWYTKHTRFSTISLYKALPVENDPTRSECVQKESSVFPKSRACYHRKTRQMRVPTITVKYF